MNRLTARGANANAPARLPGLQSARVKDPQVQKALEALREWVEVRLGSRGDAFERAVTKRELEQLLLPIEEQLDALGTFDGGVESLKATEVDGLPASVRNGAFISLTDGRLFYGLNGVWRQITLVAV